MVWTIIALAVWVLFGLTVISFWSKQWDLFFVCAALSVILFILGS